jgi:hypothetical protein
VFTARSELSVRTQFGLMLVLPVRHVKKHRAVFDVRTVLWRVAAVWYGALRDDLLETVLDITPFEFGMPWTNLRRFLLVWSCAEDTFGRGAMIKPRRRGRGNGCGSTIGERWGRSKKKKSGGGGEFLVRISFLARRGSRYGRFKTVSVLRESVRATFAVRKYSGCTYCAKLALFGRHGNTCVCVRIVGSCW